MDSAIFSDMNGPGPQSAGARIQHLLELPEAHGVTADAPAHTRSALVLRAARLAEPAALASILDEAQTRWELAPEPVRLAAGVRLLEDALCEVPGNDSRIVTARHALWTAAFSHDLRATLERRALLLATPIHLDVEPGPTRNALILALACAAPARDRESGWRAGNIVSLHASGTDPAEHLDLLLGIDKTASPSGSTRRGVLEAAADGVAVIRDPAELSTAAKAALESALDEGRFRRRGDGRERALTARVVLVGNIGRAADGEGVASEAATLAGRALRVHVPPLQLRLDDVLAVAHAGLSAVGTTFELDADTLRAAAQSAAPGHGERAVVAAARSMLLLGRPTGQAPATATVTEEPPAVPMPDTVRYGTASFDDVKAWYARHVRALCRNDVEAAERLGIHRATLAKYVRSAADEGA